MKYFVTVAGRELEVDVDGTRVTVGGNAREAHLTPVPATPLRHLLLDGESFTLPMHPVGPGRWSIGFQGDEWATEVIDARTRHIRNLTGQGTGRREGRRLAAPMPGLVLRVEVEAGQRLEAGAPVAVLEAMKMQNELRTTAPARVKAILVRPGQAVEKGEVLVEFEDGEEGA